MSSSARMPDKVARTVTNSSNRANLRDAPGRKVVYRSVLDNPFRVQWPIAPMNIQNSIIACVTDMLAGVSDYHINRAKQNRKRKRSAQPYAGQHSKKQHITQTAAVHTGAAESEIDQASHLVPASGLTSEEGDKMHDDVGSATVPQPSILQHLTIGINEVTKLLERSAQSPRQEVIAGDKAIARSQAEQPARLILVCRGDIDPPMLVQHLPHLVAACNTRKTPHISHETWLVPLSKGAETTLSDSLGLRRVSVLAIDGTAPQFSMLSPFLDTVQLLRAPWLAPLPIRTAELVPTHVKQLRTTAPKDMKIAKETRAKERVAARERKKSSGKRSMPSKSSIRRKIFQ